MMSKHLQGNLSAIIGYIRQDFLKQTFSKILRKYQNSNNIKPGLIKEKIRVFVKSQFHWESKTIIKPSKLF